MIAETERLIIRNWRAGDEDSFFRLNSDEQIMEFFPFRRNRHETRDILHTLIRRIEETGYGFFALQTRDDENAIGFIGLSMPDLHPNVEKGSVEIGWRLMPEHWGKGYATEAAERLLQMGFEERGLTEIVSFAVPANKRSTAVMKRLGMHYDPVRDFDHPMIPDDAAHLKRHVVYALTAQDWRRRKAHADTGS
ncbi:GNAT family N-acetyltransferase [Hoeflea prorocentri]|uniref:GNAT family N-acetyltransferase n=1 Tax=Hoeflea prorocentri TaxID=1922333 RepID=A0A9X3UG38_9HYPH|nr:GNAT family N-acetyltransferase [Hoeflea prorocentri]MCY6379974.1 GNAT family N-acetyltransferase [Hoeflea prorocentri]MDA5397774.1 GNAT family N-acetyltransferase [Hoeflea prorocentri]